MRLTKGTSTSPTCRQRDGPREGGIQAEADTTEIPAVSASLIRPASPKVSFPSKQPGPLERLRHLATHLPYASWCSDCVAGRGRDLAHRRAIHQGTALTEVDYAFTKFEETEQAVPIFLALLRPGGASLSILAPTKGAGDRYVVQQFLAWLDSFGIHEKVRLRSDSAAAIRSVVAKIGRRRGQVLLRRRRWDQVRHWEARNV